MVSNAEVPELLEEEVAGLGLADVGLGCVASLLLLLLLVVGVGSAQ